VSVIDARLVLHCVAILQQPADDGDRERRELLGVGWLGTVGQEAGLDNREPVNDGAPCEIGIWRFRHAGERLKLSKQAQKRSGFLGAQPSPRVGDDAGIWPSRLAFEVSLERCPAGGDGLRRGR